jgi:predicted 2-oxoglutarate/Fe(II)-dependent dioxygenase YbiX
VFTTEQMSALCGAQLIKELAYFRSFLPSWTEKDNTRERIALPCENSEGNHVNHILLTTLYSHERYSHEEDTEEMKPSLFSADTSSSQHTGHMDNPILQLHEQDALHRLVNAIDR